MASIGVGQNGFARTLLADSPAFGDGRVLYALELFKNDGPFAVADNYKKRNGVLRYSQGTESNGFNATLMAYSASWHAIDQIPQRAVNSGSLGRFNAIDQTDGGKSSRYSISGGWRQSSGTTSTCGVPCDHLPRSMPMGSETVWIYFQISPITRMTWSMATSLHNLTGAPPRASMPATPGPPRRSAAALKTR